MFCRNCGKQTADDSKYCSFCGALLEAPAPETPAPETPATSQFEPKEEQKKPVFETIDWNVNDYPNARSSVSKTEDIDFDWGANPSEVKDRYTRGLSGAEKADVKVKSEMADGLNIEDFVPSKPRNTIPEQDLSAADKIDKFYTFSKKNEDFQNLLNREYEKISGGNPIQQEKSIAEQTAERRFDNRAEDPSMEAFLKREGIEKPYEPKAFDSAVLQKIEAQERAKEQARLEEEARARALEEARLKAEAEKRHAEEVRLKIEEEARRAQQEEARRRAEEEARARAVEEARQKVAEEARRAEEESRRAENEARLAFEQELRIRAEEEARAKAEKERARRKAEDDLRAQQEAAKIRAQHEARQAVAEEEKYRAEVERRLLEEERLKNRLSQTQADLQKQANTVVANEAAKNVLNQTTRMKEEEAARIRAAVARLKGAPEPAYSQTPVYESEPAYSQTPVYESEPAYEHPIEPDPAYEYPIEPDPAYEYPIEPDLEADPILAAASVQPNSNVQTSFGLNSDPVDPNMMAHQATQETLSEMARARQEFLQNYGNEEYAPETPVSPAVDDFLEGKPVTGRNTMRSESTDMSATRTVDKNDVLAGLDATRRISKEELRAVEAIDAERFEAPSMERKDESVATVEDLLNQFSSEETQSLSEVDGASEAVEGFAVKEEPTIEPTAFAEEEEKPGLDNTMVVANEGFGESAFGTFDEYGEQEAEELKRQQEANSFTTDTPDFTQIAKEKATSRKAKGEDEDFSSEEKSGAGRVVLKILLILLIVIFAAELAGIGIKFLAANSKAADIIDNQLNKVIHLITGNEVNYDVPGIEYKV